jgi:hypothetical protein
MVPYCITAGDPTTVMSEVMLCHGQRAPTARIRIESKGEVHSKRKDQCHIPKAYLTSLAAL